MSAGLSIGLRRSCPVLRDCEDEQRLTMINALVEMTHLITPAHTRNKRLEYTSCFHNKLAGFRGASVALSNDVNHSELANRA